MHMNESTDATKGPREKALEEQAAAVRFDDDGSSLWRMVVVRAKLADALEEALYEWKALLDAYVEHRLSPPDETPEIAIHDGKIIARLRVLLREVDRGTA